MLVMRSYRDANVRPGAGRDHTARVRAPICLQMRRRLAAGIAVSQKAYGGHGGELSAMLAAHAIEEQLLLVTRNVADFDRLSQLDPRLKVAFYRI